MPDQTFYFMGVDPAPAEGARSDDGGVVTLAATLRSGVEVSAQEMDYALSAVYAERVTAKRKLKAREWAGLIHREQRAFNLAAICIDPNHGGRYITRELASTRVPIEGIETEVTPISSPDDPVSFGHQNLFLFKRGDCGVEMLWPKLPGDDNLNDAAYTEVKLLFDRVGVAFPRPYHDWSKDELAHWPARRVWALKNLNSVNLERKGSLVEQFSAWQLALHPDGTEMFTKHNARKFDFGGRKKDLASAFVYAYVAFRIWLLRNATSVSMDEEDVIGCGGMR
jgi:hypothetical protein